MYTTIFFWPGEGILEHLDVDSNEAFGRDGAGSRLRTAWNPVLTGCVLPLVLRTRTLSGSADRSAEFFGG